MSASVPSDTSLYASGQSQPVWPPKEPLALINDNFVPARHGHPPAGTVPDEIVPTDAKKPKLFDSVKLPHSPLTLKNRAIVSPMCQYSAKDGHLSPYHIAHLGQFALHGVGAIMVEASGVTAAGRITPQDAGIYSDEHIKSHASVVSTLKSISEGLTVGCQLAHAGRKASTWSPCHRGERKQPHYVTDSEGGWEKDVIAPSAIPYGEGHITPRELTTEQVIEVRDQFIAAAKRAFDAGYDFVEVHSAHVSSLFIASQSSTHSHTLSLSYTHTLTHRVT